jgi:ElaB/YqjD/DUF883 family membrane-anchored ribosome-binding protein
MTTASATLERQAETVRGDLSSTLEELRGSMTRTALASGATALAREGGATVARAAVRRASDHPLATLLIGAGLVMLLSGTRQGAGTEGRTGLGRIVDRANDAVKGTVSRVTGGPRGSDGVVATAHQAAGEAMDWTAEKASAAAASARNAAAAADDMAGTTMDKASALVSQGKERVLHNVHDMQDTTGDVAHRLTQLAREQPVLTAALAVAAGAALGALLPMTDAERRYLGPSGARVTQKGRAVAEHVAEATAAKAEEVATVAANAAADALIDPAR